MSTPISPISTISPAYTATVLASRGASPKGFLDGAKDMLVQQTFKRLLKTQYVRPEEKGIFYAENIPMHMRLARTVLGDEHELYNIMGISHLLNAAWTGLAHLAVELGPRAFIAGYRSTVTVDKRLESVEGVFTDEGGRHFARWARNYVRSHRLDVHFDGIEDIPDHGPVVYCIAPHSSIYPDFLLGLADPKMRPVADAYNFRDNIVAKRAGLALLLDAIGLPLVDRKLGPRHPKNIAHMEHCIRMGVKYGIRAAWFYNGTRVPPAYFDSGEPDMAGFYSSIPNPDDPRAYIQTGGFTANAVALAKALNKPVKVIVVTIRDAELVMPKKSAVFPFHQKSRIGGRMFYRIADTFEVDPKERGLRTIARLGRAVPKAAKEDLGIDLHLQNIVRQWGEPRGHRDSLTRFRERAEGQRGELYYIIADRIRSVPPFIKSVVYPGKKVRNMLIDELMELVHADEAPSRAAVESLLTVVTKWVLEVQYVKSTEKRRSMQEIG